MLRSKKHAKETHSDVRVWVYWQQLQGGKHLCVWVHALSAIRSWLKHNLFSESETSQGLLAPFPFPCPSRPARAPCAAEQLFQNTGQLSSEASALFMSLEIRAIRFTASKWQWLEGGRGRLVCSSSFSIHCEKGITPANWPMEIRISDNLH